MHPGSVDRRDGRIYDELTAEPRPTLEVELLLPVGGIPFHSCSVAAMRICEYVGTNNATRELTNCKYLQDGVRYMRNKGFYIKSSFKEVQKNENGK